MSGTKINPRNIVLVAMILVIALLRLIVTFNADALSFANFSSIGAVALFGGAYFRDKIKAFVFPIASLLLSDYILSITLYKQYSNTFLYDGWYYTYLAFAIMVLLGQLMVKKVTVANFLMATLATVLVHWLVTDFGVWFKSPAYTQDFAGYINCLVKAIPFELRFLYGTLGYGIVMFGSFELMKREYPALRQTATVTV